MINQADGCQAKLILLVDDDARQLQMLSGYLEKHGFRTVTALNGQAALARLAEQPVDLVVSDIRMPEMDGLTFLQKIREGQRTLPILLITAYPKVRDAVAAMRDGAVDYLEKPIDLKEMFEAINRSLKLLPAAEVDTSIPALPPGVVVRSREMRDVVKDVAVIAPSDVGILLCGESGTGKEVVADLIHGWSKRAAAPFVKLNCAAIPENLLESELFGFEKGAFTGAAGRRTGLFAKADTGTILLDEISELPAPLQAKLLRVTQDGSFIPIGGETQRKIDVRIIAATNQDLEAAVRLGKFREDLYYRLNTFELDLPPLRERREDILALADHFASETVGAHIRFADSVVAILTTYAWPGNVRELRNAVKRAVLMASGGDTILPEHLPPKIQQGRSQEVAVRDGENVIDQVERSVILQALAKNHYNRSQTARELNLSRRTLTYKIRRLRDAGFKVS